MVNTEENESSKSDKSTLPAPLEQNGVHAYPPPDWAAMQAFYGARIPVPHYYNSAYPVGHPPHPYMWCPPQAMMPPFAAPYAAIYSQGGVYAPQGVTVGQGSPKPGHGTLSTPSSTDTLAATALSIQTPGKTSGNTTGGSVGSASGDSGGSSDGSGERTASGDEHYGKRKRERSIDTEKTVKLEIQANAILPADANLASSMVTGIAVGTPVNRKLENVTALDIGTSNMSFDAQHSGSKLSSETCFQSERQLKQERRKQSNRESARRSRLRKQAETEELAVKVDVLMAENMALKSEINQLAKNSEKLKVENEKLKIAKLEKLTRIGSKTVDDNRNQTLSTENLLSRVNNSGSVVTQEEEGELYSNSNPNPTKLRQLLDASPRNDAVTAS